MALTHTKYIFVIKINALLPGKLTKMFEKKSSIHVFIQIPSKTLQGLFWAQTHHPSKFHQNPSCNFYYFCIMLQTFLLKLAC